MLEATSRWRRKYRRRFVLFDTRKRAIDKTEKRGCVQWKGIKKKGLAVVLSTDATIWNSHMMLLPCSVHNTIFIAILGQKRQIKTQRLNFINCRLHCLGFVVTRLSCNVVHFRSTTKTVEASGSQWTMGTQGLMGNVVPTSPPFCFTAGRTLSFKTGGAETRKWRFTFGWVR